MSNEFMREERYIVFKISDVVEHLTTTEALHLARLYEIQRVGRKEAGKAELECVVVEKDWPEYEPTRKAIEARVSGAQSAPNAVAYLDIGAGGYMDIGTGLTDEELDAIPEGRHMLGIVGTYGVEGYVPAQPAPIERLRASLEAAEKEGDTMRTKISDLTINVEYLGNLKKSYEELIGELQDDRDALRAEIEELHALIAAVKKQANAEFYLRVKKEEEYARLRAKIEAMEKQAPAYWGPKHAIEGGSTTVIVGKFPVNPTDAPLYALPGAKGEEE